jgi:hypothetical protein
MKNVQTSRFRTGAAVRTGLAVLVAVVAVAALGAFISQRDPGTPEDLAIEGAAASAAQALVPFPAPAGFTVAPTKAFCPTSPDRCWLTPQRPAQAREAVRTKLAEAEVASQVSECTRDPESGIEECAATGTWQGQEVLFVTARSLIVPPGETPQSLVDVQIVGVEVDPQVDEPIGPLSRADVWYQRIAGDLGKQGRCAEPLAATAPAGKGCSAWVWDMPRRDGYQLGQQWMPQWWEGDLLLEAPRGTASVGGVAARGADPKTGDPIHVNVAYTPTRIQVLLSRTGFFTGGVKSLFPDADRP